ncbi:hypothetical protein NQ318_017340 [Aromia moschata]|uniref:TATA element modulatory factor n=1 Tax=Aromia moschata TaxID=1265417 RepID=A0AAV8XA47_9CUCU|nr:hypothetical protein NQ318_017340 [Aromia moschata]
MSWFDAAGLANIAKSALKEAQKTIDKALDIKEDHNLVPTNTPVDTNSEDFFGIWGVSQSEQHKDVLFFDTSNETVKSSSIDILEDSVDPDTEHFSQSKLVVQHSEEMENHLSITETEIDGDKIKEDLSNFMEINLDATDNLYSPTITAGSTLKKNDKPQSTYTNRLSVVSNESGKNNSDSVDIITCSTECTTSPESDVLSLGLSISTSSSALGLKPTSDSVEILCDSLTSPSSVEVIATDSTDSMKQSERTDEFVSPLESPWSDDKSSSIEKISPESVEVIPEDQDENSIAEDTMSYTSISESTSATVLDSAFNLHLKPQKMLKDTYNRPETMSENNTSDLSLSPDRNCSFADAITRAPSRSNMHLPLTQVNQVLIDTQPQGTKQDIVDILQKTNIIDIPQDDDIITSSSSETQLDVSIDDGSQSDKTIICNDNLMESSSDTSTTTETSSNSTYLKHMLADAMAEKSDQYKDKLCGSSNTTDPLNKSSVLESISISHLDMPPRENSPISSESRSDLVKIGSDHTSGHTSGDELETTTSSDIEIISSPNGDSSSTQSRQSPAKQTCIKVKSGDTSIDTLLCKMTIKKAKGHTRELSEASSISDDSHSSEIDRLLKRISEMTDILESRESKLIDMNRRNAELQELNNDLKFQLDSVITKQLESADLSQVTEEYTQRLSALEKKFQQAIREKDSLRKQLEQAKQEAATRMSRTELEALLSEKDEVIKELREEG